MYNFSTFCNFSQKLKDHTVKTECGHSSKSSLEKSGVKDAVLGFLLRGSYLNFLHFECNCIIPPIFLHTATSVPCLISANSQYAHCGSILPLNNLSAIPSRPFTFGDSILAYLSFVINLKNQKNTGKYQNY